MAIGAILAGVSAAASLAGGISKASNDSKNAKKQQKAAKKAAKVQNKYQKKKFEADKKNFLAQREYNYEIAMKQYEYQTDVQNLQYNAMVKAYNRDQQNLADQLAYNDIGAQRAFMREQNVLREISDEQAFSREQIYVQSLKDQASARLGASGASSDRAMMMALAEKGRNLAIMDASFSGAIRESNLNMFDIAMNKIGADQRARAQTMLRPDKPIPLVTPTRTPLPEFVEPPEVQPGFVAQTDALGSILGGVAGAANAFAGVNFTNPTPPPTNLPNIYNSPIPGVGSNNFNNNFWGLDQTISGDAFVGKPFTSNPFAPPTTTGAVPLQVLPFGG